MIRKKKRYLKPRKLYVTTRIKEENALMKKYALKNKREIWKTLARVNYFRARAKELSRAPHEERENFFVKLRALGLKTHNSADVLGLKVEDLLERRLPTIVVKKNIATTAKQARQLVVHKKILIKGKVLDAPSYLVPVADEDSILLKTKQKTKKPKEEKSEETISEENSETENEN